MMLLSHDATKKIEYNKFEGHFIPESESWSDAVTVDLHVHQILLNTFNAV